MHARTWFCVLMLLGGVGCIDLPEVVDAPLPEDPSDAGTGNDAGPGAAPDTASPTLALTQPRNGAENVPAASALEVEFTEAMSKSSVRLSVDPSVDLVLSGWDSAAKRVSFTPMKEWNRSTLYIVTVEGSDLAGNALSGARAFSFTTQSPEAPTDTTPPSLISMAPGQASIGQARDVSPRLTFSEPMNKTSVEQSFTFTAPADHVPGTLTFTWNPEGTEVTVDPQNEFAHGAAVTWRLGTEARDISGNAVPEELSGQFSVVRLVSATIAASGDRGTLTGAPDYQRLGNLTVGEYLMKNTSTRSYLNFNLADVPLEATRIVSANLTWTTSSGPGTAFYFLGDLLIESVDYGQQLEEVARDFDGPVRGEPVVVQGESYPPAASMLFRVSVTPLVAEDLANRDSQANRSQFRIRFAIANNQDSTESRITIDGASFTPKLEISYEQP